MRIWIVPLVLVLVSGSARTSAAAEPSESEKVLQAVKIGTDGPALVNYFRKRILPDRDLDRVHKLIRQLGDDDFQKREQASGALLAFGPSIAPLLRQAATSADPEVAARARECLDQAERTTSVPVVTAAIQVLAQRKPEEAVEVLLGFAPMAESEPVLEALREGLAQLAISDKKPHPLLVQALTDKVPLKRALASEVLFRAGALDVASAQKFLKDSDVSVRLRMALALVESEHRETVPALIGLLSEVPLEQAWTIEDLLGRIAGEQSPPTGMTADVATRKQARELWEAWWQKNGATANLVKLKDRVASLGLTLVAYNENNGTSKVVELGRDGKQRWELANLQGITTAEMVPGDRILITESFNNRVSERNRKGEIVWQKQINTQPLACHRVPGNRTLIVCRNQLIEVDAKGEQVFTYNRPNNDLVAARKLKNGEYVVVTRLGRMMRVDAKGKEVKTMTIDRTNTSYVNIDITPTGNVLIPTTRTSRVVEYDPDGKEVWSVKVTYPTSVQRLPNGHTMITSMTQRKLIEVDRNGKTVNEITIPGTPLSARRR